MPSRKHPVKVTLPQFFSPFIAKGAFGTVNEFGQVVFRDSDRMEVQALAELSRDTGQYVFKHRNGAYGYLDDNGGFVPLG